MIATANATLEATTVAIIVVVVINAVLVWLPLLVHIFAPGVTSSAAGDVPAQFT